MKEMKCVSKLYQSSGQISTMDQIKFEVDGHENLCKMVKC